jgi:hypothetical protein
LTNEPAPLRQQEGRLLEIGGLAFVLMALLLLALGGLATGSDPTAFDLWVLAIGLFLIAGGIVWFGVQREVAATPALSERSYEGPASLAEAPLLSASPAADPFGLRRPLSATSGWGASDSIAGQYAEAAGFRTNRYTQRRLVGPGEPAPSVPQSVPFWASLRREAVPAREAGLTPTPAQHSGSVEAELERLRARVADLEAGRPPRDDASRAVRRASGGIGTCAGCQAPISGALGEGLCPQCGRPLCPRCYGSVPSGPEAHWCPECRVGRRLSPPIGPPGGPNRSAATAPTAASG